MKCEITTSSRQWLAKLRLEDPPVSDKNAHVCSCHFLPEDFVNSMLEDFGPSKKTLKPDAVPSVFSYVPPPKRRKTSEYRIAQTTHQDIINELLSPGPSQQSEPEPFTKDVGIQCD